LPRTQTPSPSPSLTKRPSTKLLPGRASAFTHSLGGLQSYHHCNVRPVAQLIVNPIRMAKTPTVFVVTRETGLSI
jgi:hypothetical protein